MKTIEPLLHPVEITAIRPTQMTVGMGEVARKRLQWQGHIERDGPEFLGRHMIPVVLGPKERHWMIDHHHLALALHQEGVSHVLVNIVADLHDLKRESFLAFMDSKNWLHPYDAKGERQTAGKLPRHVSGLTDDPYRSLAGALRRAGGYAKDATPYSEFLWANFLRRRINPDMLVKDPEAALGKALSAARSKDASYLPGWAGASD
jgi:hypothetical protein